MCSVDVAGKNNLKIKVQTLTAVFNVDLEMLADLFKYIKNSLHKPRSQWTSLAAVSLDHSEAGCSPLGFWRIYQRGRQTYGFI